MKTLFQKLFGRTDPTVIESDTKQGTTQPRAAAPFRSATVRELDQLLRGTYRFVAVDVETANRNQGSICQIGMALVSSDGRIDTVGILIDPEQDFEDFNVDLHGIDEETVRGALTFDLALQTLRPFLERHILIQHSSFDKQAFNAACASCGIPTLRAKWLDSVQIARRAWPELKGNGGHGLANLKDHLNLEFEHHDAEEDARAAAEVTLLAEGKTGQSFSELSEPKKRQHQYQPSLAVEGNQQGPLYGHVACFTGQLTMSRVEAATFAAGAGIAVKTGVSKKVTLLVVGDQDMTLLAGHDKSSKHRRAEELMEQGHEIKIVGESEFMKLINSKSGN
jgi:DNA polymerase-3 subunit epsilon